jgi:hypothetical protein
MTFDRKIKIDNSTVLMIYSVHSPRGPVYNNIKLYKYDFTHFGIPMRVTIHMIFVDLCIIIYFTQKKSNKMQQCIKILFHIYMKLNMFRATHHPSSGA